MADPRWLSADEQRIWRAYLAMHAQLTARLHRQLQADTGLSLTDFEVLVQLTDRPDGQARISELAQGLQWEKSRLSHHLARMQRRGLITREGCPEDARGAFAVLTPQGRDTIEKAAPCHVETVRQLFFDQLAPHQIKTLKTISDKVLAGLDNTRAAAT
jgi:DNA-binding MarR family transcriptional regulator